MRTRADKISEINLASGPVKVDEAGFLVDPETWTREFVEYRAEIENIDLLAEHWEVLEFMRTSWSENGVAVDARHVFNLLKKKHDVDKAGAKSVLFDLFPYGYVKQAVKMAGMKQPRAWSTG